MKITINDVVIDNIATPAEVNHLELILSSQMLENNIKEVHTTGLPEDEGVKFTIYMNDGRFVNGLVQVTSIGLPYVPTIVPVENITPEVVTPDTTTTVNDSIPTHIENF